MEGTAGFSVAGAGGAGGAAGAFRAAKENLRRGAPAASAAPKRSLRLAASELPARASYFGKK